MTIRPIIKHLLYEKLTIEVHDGRSKTDGKTI